MRSYQGFSRHTFEVSSQCSAAKIIHNTGDGCQGQTYRGQLPSDFFVFLILYWEKACYKNNLALHPQASKRWNKQYKCATTLQSDWTKSYISMILYVMEHNNSPKVKRVVSYLPQLTILLLPRPEYKIIIFALISMAGNLECNHQNFKSLCSFFSGVQLSTEFDSTVWPGWTKWNLSVLHFRHRVKWVIPTRNN